MDVLHINTTDTEGGAARAANRLHKGLQSLDIDSKMLVQRKYSDDDSVFEAQNHFTKANSKVRSVLDQLPIKLYRNREPQIFSPSWLPENLNRTIKHYNPDIVHLHWVADGFMHPSTIGNISTPVVWTLHDMWPFTGGCHIAGDCSKYMAGCGECPQLNSGKQNDLANFVWENKRQSWNEKDFQIVGPSSWMASKASQSKLFKHEDISVIPNGLDTSKFSPRDKDSIRTELGIGPRKKIICFGASYSASFKGMDLLYDSLEYLNNSDYQIVAFGAQIDEKIQERFSIIHIGYTEGEQLWNLYSSADVIIVPSRTESFGQIASESLASGTPVVAFNSTGLKDIVNHKETGYLADTFEPADLAYGVEWILEKDKRIEKLGEQARNVAENRFAIGVVAERYHELYKSALSR